MNSTAPHHDMGRTAVHAPVAFPLLARKAAAAGLAAVVIAAFAGWTADAQAAATIVINNINDPGVGFNDTTPVSPVGGNPGTTLGQQRLFAFTYAANLWGATLTSSQPIVIDASMTPLTCNTELAVLGSASAASAFRDFPGAPLSGTLYPYALANKLSGTYLGTANATQIRANFNSDLGLNANCFPGRPFYLGVDNKHGTKIDFIAVLLHEMAHGLGFLTLTDGTTGAQNGSVPGSTPPNLGFPSVWDHFLLDTVTGKVWKDMTNGERVASAVSSDKLVWSGAKVTAAVPSVLRFGLASATFSGPAAAGIAGTVRVGEADFGRPLGTPVTGAVALEAEQTLGAGEACEPLNAANARAVKGKFALVNSLACAAAIKVKNAQDAGALGVLVSYGFSQNTAAPLPLFGSDPTITIPVVQLFSRDGNKLREALKPKPGAATGGVVMVSLGLAGGAQYAGADPMGRALMYAPRTYGSGSSVSHFDTSMFRNQLMEAIATGDLTSSLVPPQDLTFRLLQDIGW